MTIALTADDARKDLMVQFCTAYAGLLSGHTFVATSTTGNMVAKATGLDVLCLMPGHSGGYHQLLHRICYGEVDMLLAFRNPKQTEPRHLQAFQELMRACDDQSVPVATNIATAEVVVQGLAHGDLDWRMIKSGK